MPEQIVYLSGPMTGYEDFNYPAFAEAAANLIDHGYGVLNPADNHGGRTDLPRHVYMRTDIGQLLKADAVFVLPEWEGSPGARLEVLVARELGLPVYSYEAWRYGCDAEPGGTAEVGCEVHTSAVDPDYPPTAALTEALDTGALAETITAEAERIVYGDRGNDYGHPREDFTRTAVIWTGLLQQKLADGEFIDADDIARCQIGVKLSRDVSRPKRDNRTDIAGYALCLDRLDTGR